MKKEGITPILVTLTPRPFYKYWASTGIINKWIKESGEYYVDFHKALTMEVNPSCWNADLVLPDEIHPNLKGYDMMYEQVKIDCPYLFN